jgi:pimeloyl-ACP methyl ester carboxylesterase
MKGRSLEAQFGLAHNWNGETVEIVLKTAEGPDAHNKPGLVWLGGFRSDMEGTKAVAVVEEAELLGCSSLRFDYSGHGSSGGVFRNGTISRWVDESLAVFLAHTKGQQILIGSSMGAWIALRLAQILAEKGMTRRLSGLLLIAPAPDFTTRLMEPSFSDTQLRSLQDSGFIEEPSAYSDEPNIITRALIEDGRTNQVMSENLAVGAPVRIVQGMRDPDVPFDHALQLVECLAHDDVQITLVKDGDHRLSRDEDISLLRRTIGQLVDQA